MSTIKANIYLDSSGGNTATINGITPTSLVTAQASMIGVNQTWQDVSASRANTTNYVNNTGKPIMVNVQYNQTGNNGAALLVDSVTVSQGAQQGVATGNMVSAIVPNGSTYRLNAGTNGFIIWAELR